jgi:hypothetical protein
MLSAPKLSRFGFGLDAKECVRETCGVNCALDDIGADISRLCIRGEGSPRGGCGWFEELIERPGL